MPFPQEEWEQIRCQNPSCPSKAKGGPGRIIIEHHPRSGLYRKIVGKLNGKPLIARFSVPPIQIPCETCGRQWFSPQLMIYDDMALVHQAAVAETAEQQRLANEARSNVLPVGDRFRRVDDAA